MFRRITMIIGLSVGTSICTVGSGNAATYCAKYVGSPERIASGARSQCEFATLKECRASVRARGGGHCYKKEQMR
jgi:hypothetical protein